MNTTEGHISPAPSRRTLYTVLGGGALAAAALLVGAVLPAEYGIDPLGIGRATGLSRLAQPEEVEIAVAVDATGSAPAQFHSAPPRSDSIDIRLEAAGDPDGRDQLEWKVRMKAGQAMVYSWRVDVPPEQFYADFHAETDPKPEVQLLTFRKGFESSANGSVVAQFDGVHGWYFQNQAEEPVIVRVQLSGFYELAKAPTTG